MKKLLITAFITVIAFTVNAQTEKSTLLLGGDLTFSSASNGGGGGSTSTFSLSPSMGYFFMKNFAVGGMFNLTSTSGYTDWSIGPIIRGYFTDNTNGKPFAQAGLGFGGVTSGGNSSNSVMFQLKAGYALFLNKSIAVEFAGNLLTKKGQTVFGFGAGFQIHFARK